jgi:hypothetical protein
MATAHAQARMVKAALLLSRRAMLKVKLVSTLLCWPIANPTDSFTSHLRWGAGPRSSSVGI